MQSRLPMHWARDAVPGMDKGGACDVCFFKADPPSHRGPSPGILWIFLSHGKFRVASSLFPHLSNVAHLAVEG